MKSVSATAHIPPTAVYMKMTTAPIAMPASMGREVRDLKISPNATSVAPTQTILENSVVSVMPNAATGPKRWCMKSTTVMMRNRRNRRAKNNPIRISARAPPHGSSITPSIPSS